MKKIDTYRRFDDEGYQVMTLDECSGLQLLGECPPLPIGMEIAFCQNESNESVDIAEIAEVDFSPRADKDFYCHFVEILHGQYDGWMLTRFQIRCCGVALEYFCPATDASEEIVLNILKNGLHHIRIHFNVPHTNGKPDTQYVLHATDCCKGTSIWISEKTQDSYILDFFNNDTDDFTTTCAVPTEAGEIIYTDF